MIAEAEGESASSAEAVPTFDVQVSTVQEPSQSTKVPGKQRVTIVEILDPGPSSPMKPPPPS